MNKLLDRLRDKVKAEGGSMSASTWPSVIVPQAPIEPDERIDKMTGLPYDLQAGGAFVDEEDRLGFSAAGLVKLIQRLRRSPREAVTDARPTTRIEGEDAAKETLRDFRYRQPENFIDPNDPRLNIIAVKPDKEDTFVKYLDEEEGMTLDSFSRSTDKDEIIRNYQLSNPENEFVDIQYTPQNIYYNRRAEVEGRLAKELDDEFNAIPVEDEGIVREYLQAIPRVSEKPPINATLTKEEFLKGSKETNPQFHGKFFGSVQYDNELASNLPRELGMHIGTKGQSENIVMRRVNPTLDKLIEDEAKFDYMKRGLAKTEDEAAVLVKDKGVPDKIYDDIKEDFLDSVPTGVDPQVREGFINVKNPLVLDTDMINWNPAKFLGGYDPEGKLKLAEQADSFVAALNAQVKLPPERFTEIINSRAEEINFFIRKKEMNSGELLNDIYDYQINIATRSMLEDLGFDSIQYKNLGELARVSEKQAGGHSYILFRDDQFVTDFKPSLYERPKGTLRETIPEVQKAYDDLKAGNITPIEYDNIVNNTVYPYESVPTPETNEAMSNALTKKQAGKINAAIEEDQLIGLRLDINAYLKEEPDKAWVPTIHVGKKAVGHQSTASLRNADFTMPAGKVSAESGAEKAQDIMDKVPGFKGRKSPFAQIEGNYVNRTPEENFRLAQEALNSDEWVQVGFDPRRHSFFYDRVTGQPVATAEEVIQVGPLVLAKKATYADRSLYPYATGGKVLGSLHRHCA